MKMRSIDDILLFRQDISPFLVHLTRDKDGKAAEEILKKVIAEKRLAAGDEAKISDARFGIKTTTNEWTQDKLRQFFGALCFTETPINEIHCLLEIGGRQVQLQPYGLVFMKRKLQERYVAPVLYLNNEKSDKDEMVSAICTLINTHPKEAAELLPLVSIFGNKLTPPGAAKQQGSVDFRWEREWRLPSIQCPLSFDAGDVFIGLCPHNEIAEFDALFPDVGFIDPTRNMKWYASKLIASRQRLNLKHSVV